MKNVTELAKFREELELAANEQTQIADLIQSESRAMTDTEMARFDELADKKVELKKQIATFERLETVKSDKASDKFAAPVIHTKKANVGDAGRAWLTNGVDQLFKSEYADAANDIGFKWRNESFSTKLYSNSEMLQFSSDGQVKGNAARGGYSVNDLVIQGFERALKSFWGWQDIVTVVRTPKGDDYGVLCNNDTGNLAGYVAEMGTVPATDTTFARKTLKAYKIGSGIYPVSSELIEDSSEDIMSLVGYNNGTRCARFLSQQITNGDGNTGHIRGFTNDVTQGYETIYVDAVTDADMVGLYFTLDEAYRNSPKCAWMMHSLIAAGLVLNNGNLTTNGFTGAPQLSYLGKPIFINDNLPSTFEAGEPCVYFGDWSKLNVRIVRDVTFGVDTSIFFKEEAVATKATLRADSLLIDAGTHPVLSLVVNGDSGAPHYHE
ncbi:phage major capsid protein [Anatilimnocola floriformis]|uniref:phage major capsid protein n=1 Tax=Anatilimnocola floriformis TaxID=2948575 RepID=UPI0020C36682|nr:phage major capsid protein [Anatilimnocola floriformis]